MKQRLPTLVRTIAVGIIGACLLVAASPAPGLVYAADPADTACEALKASGGSCDGAEDGLTPVIKTVVNGLLFVVGVASVITLIIGGLRYTLAGGDQQAVGAAKNTILYAIIGLIVAIMAYAIANYVVSAVEGTTTEGTSAPNPDNAPPPPNNAQ
jgi:hypothetical protein